MIWYIGIDSLKDLVAPNWEFGFDLEHPANLEKTPEEHERAVIEHLTTVEAKNRLALWEVASRVKTDFNLVGPKNCTSKILANALWAAGRQSVAADLDSRREVCQWLDKAGFPSQASCDAPPEGRAPALPLKFIKKSSKTYDVECN
jgi:hypothetical protein